MATAKLYGKARESLWAGTINWVGGSVKAMACTASYTPDQDVHKFKSDVTNETSGTGYTAGGLTVTTKTAVYDGSTNTIVLDCDDTIWNSSSISLRYVVLYVDTGTASTSPLIGYVDQGSTLTSISGPIGVVWDATGAIRDSVS
jgi:hypothetical protein